MRARESRVKLCAVGMRSAVKYFPIRSSHSSNKSILTRLGAFPFENLPYFNIYFITGLWLENPLRTFLYNICSRCQSVQKQVKSL